MTITSAPQTDASWTRRYLSLIGAKPEPPSPAALTRLIRAHTRTSVFENVTAILRRAAAGPTGPVPPVDLDALLTARASRSGGGVCFDQTPLFRQLLASLGYCVQPLLAEISFPGSHHATRVDLDGAQYLVDVGGASPLSQAIPLGETVEVHHAGLAFRYRPTGSQEPDTYVQERHVDGQWHIHCRYDLRPAAPAAIEAAYQRHHLPHETWVVGSLTVVRITGDAVFRLRDDELVTHTASGKTTRRLTSPPDYQDVAASVFDLPHLPVAGALAYLASSRPVRA